MTSHRPRRAMPASLAARVARVARVAVPILLTSTGVTAVVVSAWPAESQVAAPVLSAVPSVAPSRLAPIADTPSTPPSAPTTSPTTAKATSESSLAKAKRTDKAKPTDNAKPTDKAKLSASSALKLKVTGTKFASIELNVRVKPTQDAKVVGEIKAGKKVSITDSVKGDYRYVSFDKKGYWVKKKYLVDNKTLVAAAAGISTQPCTRSTGVESGLTSDAVKVYRAICARFPQVTSFGGNRGGGGNHGSGRAIDAMVSGADGAAIAGWLRANAKRLGVSEVIYAQRIWTVQRSGDGWRAMSDRGSATANHYDHVHVSVYGSRASE